MKVSAEESLWLALPILLIVVALLGGIFYLQNTNTDVRSRASEPAPSIYPQKPSSLPQEPEVVCNDMYDPVCSANGKTYPNSCEANLAGATVFVKGVCVTPTQVILPNTP